MNIVGVDFNNKPTKIFSVEQFGASEYKLTISDEMEKTSIEMIITKDQVMDLLIGTAKTLSYCNPTTDTIQEENLEETF